MSYSEGDGNLYALDKYLDNITSGEEAWEEFQEEVYDVLDSSIGDELEVVYKYLCKNEVGMDRSEVKELILEWVRETL